MTALRIMEKRLELAAGGALSVDLDAEPSWTEARLSLRFGNDILVEGGPIDLTAFLLLPCLDGICESDRVPDDLLPLPFGLGAESAVLNSGSLKSASANSSASSELPPSNPANRLLIRWGRLSGAFWLDSGPSSLFPG